tara:strand:- start:652 stop:1209 length:558 start_codon:yes stop_codon:yes gene_type:complete
MSSLEKQLAQMTKKFNMAKQDRDKYRRENEELKAENQELKEGENALKTCRIKAVFTLSQLKKETLVLKKGIIEEHARAERCKDKLIDLADISKGLQKDVKKLQEENDELKMNTHRLNCSHCNLISSEDDLFLSLDCGEFTCEGCFNEGKSKIIDRTRPLLLQKENQELFEELEYMKKEQTKCLID